MRGESFGFGERFWCDGELEVFESGNDLTSRRQCPANVETKAQPFDYFSAGLPSGTSKNINVFLVGITTTSGT